MGEMVVLVVAVGDGGGGEGVGDVGGGGVGFFGKLMRNMSFRISLNTGKYEGLLPSKMFSSRRWWYCFHMLTFTSKLFQPFIRLVLSLVDGVVIHFFCSVCVYMF